MANEFKVWPLWNVFEYMVYITLYMYVYFVCLFFPGLSCFFLLPFYYYYYYGFFVELQGAGLLFLIYQFWVYEWFLTAWIRSIFFSCFFSLASDRSYWRFLAQGFKSENEKKNLEKREKKRLDAIPKTATRIYLLGTEPAAVSEFYCQRLRQC